jgi:hypothetical protein
MKTWSDRSATRSWFTLHKKVTAQSQTSRPRGVRLTDTVSLSCLNL